MSRNLELIFKHLAQRPSLLEVGVEAYRSYVELGGLAFKPAKDITETPFSHRGIKGLWLTPDNAEPGRSLLHIHGGGFIAGSGNSYRDMGSRLAREARCPVLVFDYRLAPEHPFPAGLEDAQIVHHHLATTLDHPVALSGDSAGGNIAVALVHQCIREQRPLPACLGLISPWLDLTGNAKSIITNKDKDPMLRPPDLAHTATLYAGDHPLDHPRVSPLFGDFKGFPPSLIQVGATEVLLDDSRTLARRLTKAGGQADLEIWDEMFHVWHYFARYLKQGRQALGDMGAFIRSHS